MWPDNRPGIISDFDPGVPLCDASGKPNETLLRPLTFLQRIDLILQIASQYQRIHQHAKTPMAHVDVKGHNLMVHAPRNGQPNATVIDFGSALNLIDGKTTTGLAGLTSYAIPPEAIENVSDQDTVELTELTGELTARSDIYALGPLFSGILGASDPYSQRRGPISNGDQIDLDSLDAQIRAGFDSSGLLDKRVQRLDLTLSKNSLPCALVKKTTMSAPNDETILSDQNTPDLGYVYYLDDLVYVNKYNQTIGRTSRTKKQFQILKTQIDPIEETKSLSAEHILLCENASRTSHQEKMKIDYLLTPMMKDFVSRMSDKEPDNRPNTDEVVRFFNTINQIALISKHHSNPLDEQTERQVMIHLIQLYLQFYKAWDLELTLSKLPDETGGRVTFSNVDFNALSQRDLEQLWQWCHTKNIDPTIPTTPHDFEFINISSDGVKTFEAIKSKLGITELDEEQIKGKIVVLMQRTKHLSSDILTVTANTLLDFSPNMMASLITETPFETSDLTLTYEFVLKKDTIQALSPTLHDAIVASLGENKLASLEQLKTFSTTICERFEKDIPLISLMSTGYDLTTLWSVPTADNPEFNWATTPTQATPSQQMDLLYDLLRSVQKEKTMITAATSEAHYDRLVKNICAPLLKQTQDYIQSLNGLDEKAYRRGRFFGSHTVGEKKAAAEAFITALTTGEYEALFNNKAIMRALTKKTLGQTTRDLLNNMFHFDENRATRSYHGK